MTFLFEHDLGRRFLRVEIAGFWTASDVESFQKKAASVLQQAIAAGATVGEGRILLVADRFPVQDRAIAKRIGQMLPLYGKLSKRVAIVLSDSKLQRLQVKRLVAANVALFQSEQDATDWLFAA